jgi:hypothetical protein
MTDKNTFVNEGRDRATDNRSPHAHRGWTGFLAHRWPTAVGVVLAALTAFDLRIDAESVPSFSALVVLMPLVYVGAAAVGRRGFAWVVFLAAVTSLILTQVLDLKINLHAAFLAAALAFLALGAARGRLRGPSGVPLQAAGMLVFGAGMLVALYAEPVLGGILVAIGLIGHAAWDAFHYARDRVVARSYAEFCAVVDLLVGAAVLFVLFMPSTN